MESGDMIGPYRLTEKIGQGGIATVWAATQDTTLEGTAHPKEVAIKVTPLDQEDVAPLDEAELGKHMHHPNLVAIQEQSYEVNGYACIVMERFLGDTLFQLLPWRLPPIQRRVHLVVACEIMRQVALGLAWMHSRQTHDPEQGCMRPLNAWHGDITPNNIMVGQHGAVKLFDYAMSPFRGRTLPLPSGIIQGTPAYMSPEQVTATGPDYKSDIFVCGTVFYELVTGQRPFRGESLMGLMQAIARRDGYQSCIADVERLASPSAAQVLRRCWMAHPDYRHASAHDLAEALASVQEDAAGTYAPSARAHLCAWRRARKRAH